MLCTFDEIKRLKNENTKQIFFSFKDNEALKKELEEGNQMIINLKVEIKEAKRREEVIIMNFS